MPAMAVSRMARDGCASGKERNWARMAGDASIRIQLAASALIATDDCVRERALIRPRRNPSQLRQLQFHCGKPPPAAEPRTCTLTVHGRPPKRSRRRRQPSKMPIVEPRPGIRRGVLQRVRTYIVISKPKRKSTNSGFVHIIMYSMDG